MAITVLLQVYHTAQQGQLVGSPADQRIVIPNVDPRGTVGEQIKSFVQERLGVPLNLQELTAPLFEELADSQPATYLPHAFLCEPSAETSQLYVDEDSLSLWGVHAASQIELFDDDRLAEKHVVDQAVLRLRVLPAQLDQEDGGRVFVETKAGLLPLLGIRPTTRVRFLKEMLCSLLSTPLHHQTLSSAGRVMHDDQQIADFEGLHAVYADSVLDLCCTGDAPKERAHRRMVVHVSILDGREVSVVVSGRDRVRDVMVAVENRTGLPADQQKVTYNGKTLDESWLLWDAAVSHDCTLHVAPYSSLLRSISYGTSSEGRVQQFHPELLSPPPEDGQENGNRKKRKIKLMRVRDGRIVGTLKLTFASGETVADVRRRLGRHLRPLSDQNENEMSRDSWDVPTPSRAPEVRPRTVYRKSMAPPAELQPLGTPSPPNKMGVCEDPIADAEFSFIKPPMSTLASEKSMGQSMSLSAWKRQQDRLDAMRRSLEAASAPEDQNRMKVHDWLAADVPSPDGVWLAELHANKEEPRKHRRNWLGAKSKILRALRFGIRD
eukprot:TRINITY_DN17972_c0_g1_i1.p1 TRINITY_DN17972_c0_g1~~TRINITY_DN17972_c0_g1_i1.p1  ORF type:complete len:550 (-),score=75.75 TRINITY_DN17972_c0_g1_i1:532-2181(-)